MRQLLKESGLTFCIHETRGAVGYSNIFSYIRTYVRMKSMVCAIPVTFNNHKHLEQSVAYSINEYVQRLVWHPMHGN
jgi:hypothetical protein